MRRLREPDARGAVGVTDVVPALAAFALEVSFLLLITPLVDTADRSIPLPVGLALLGLRSAPLVLRRRAPLAVLGFLTVLLVVTATIGLGVANFAFVAAVYTAAARVRRPRSAVALVVPLVVVVLYDVALGRLELLPLEVLTTFAAWVLGDRAQTQRAYAASLEEAGRLAVREREERALRQLADERARIARELHDVVAQAVVLVVLQTGAARRVLGTQPDVADGLLDQVESAGRRGLQEMRRMLTVLRPESSDPRLSDPGIDDLAVLARQFAAAGLPVHLELAGEERPLPPDLSLTGYRVVQEALTNALKHANATDVRVRVDRGDDGLTIEVCDNGTTPRARLQPAGGQGLRGMRERVRALGGAVDAGPRPGGGFAVHARLPLGAAPDVGVP
jgi:signal transduction histidine kinase